MLWRRKKRPKTGDVRSKQDDGREREKRKGGRTRGKKKKTKEAVGEHKGRMSEGERLIGVKKRIKERRKYEKAWKGPQGLKEEGGGVCCSQKH